MRVLSDLRIHEVSICTFPAYAQTDVAVAQRSLAAFQTGQPVAARLHRMRMHMLRARQ